MPPCTSTLLDPNASATQAPDHHQHLPGHNPLLTVKTSGFPIRNLPFELRRLIYTRHLANSPPLSVNSSNATLPLHKTHALHSSSPYFHTEIPASVYHASQVFSFSNGRIMRQFAQCYNRQQDIRKIRIMLDSPDDEKERHRDWMWLVQDCFRKVSDVELVLPACNGEKAGGGMVTKRWWDCVEDAFREGMGYRIVEWELFDGALSQGFTKKFPRLKLVNAEGMPICWSKYSDNGKSNNCGCLL